MTYKILDAIRDIKIVSKNIRMNVDLPSDKDLDLFERGRRSFVT